MSKSNWITLCVIVVVGALVGYIAFSVYRSSQVSHAQSMFDQGDYQAVIDYLEPKTDGGHGTVNARVLLAEAYYRLLRYDEALQVAQPHIQFGQEDPRAVALTGWILVNQGALLQAQERFTKLKALGETAEADAGMAAVLLKRSEGYRQKDISDAQFHLSDALAEDPDLVEARLMNAEVKLIQTNFDGAAEEAQKAVALEPHWHLPYQTLGRARLSAQRYEDAEEAFRKALECGGSPDETNYYLAQSLYMQGRIADARQQLQTIIDEGGAMQTSALLDSARINLAMGDADAALLQLNKAWSIDPRPSIGLQLYYTLSRLHRGDEAEALLDEIIADRPFIPEALLERGHRMTRRGAAQAAYDVYQNAVEQDPDNLWALYNLGCLALETPQSFLAPEFFNNALRIDEDFFAAQLNYALGLLSSNKRDEARPILEPLAQSHPDQSAVLRARALERFQSGDTESALRILQHEPVIGDADVLQLLRGEIWLRVFQYADAAQALESIVENRPDWARARMNLGHAAFRQERFDDAESHYQWLEERKDTLSEERQQELKNAQALLAWKRDDLATAMNLWDELRRRSGANLGKRFAGVNASLARGAQPTAEDMDRLMEESTEPDSLPESLYNLALNYQRQGRSDAAISSYLSLLKEHHQFLPALANLAKLLGERGRHNESAQLLDRARRAAPERIDVVNNYAAALLQDGRVDEAADQLDQALALDGSNITLMFNRGVAALERGNLNEAQAIYDQLNEQAPAAGERLYLLGLIQYQAGDAGLAAETLQRAVDIMPSNPYAAMNYGIVLAQLERYEQAEEYLSISVSLDPSLAEAYRALGVLYGQRGLYQEAYEQLQNAIRMNPSLDGVLEAMQQIEGWLAQEAG